MNIKYTTRDSSFPSDKFNKTYSQSRDEAFHSIQEADGEQSRSLPSNDRKSFQTDNTGSGFKSSTGMKEIRQKLSGNEISEADLKAAEKGKTGPKIHVKLEAQKKIEPGELAEELNKLGAELPEKKTETKAAFPWWAILLIVLLILAILAAIVALTIYMRKKRQQDPKKKKLKGATANIQAKRDPQEYKCLSAGYIDEIAMMGEEEEADNQLKGIHSSDFPTLKEAKKRAKKNKSSVQEAIGWD